MMNTPQSGQVPSMAAKAEEREQGTHSKLWTGDGIIGSLYFTVVERNSRILALNPPPTDPRT